MSRETVVAIDELLSELGLNELRIVHERMFDYIIISLCGKHALAALKIAGWSTGMDHPDFIPDIDSNWDEIAGRSDEMDEERALFTTEYNARQRDDEEMDVWNGEDEEDEVAPYEITYHAPPEDDNSVCP